MNDDTLTQEHGPATADLIRLPVQAPRGIEASPLVQRLVSVHGARALTPESVAAWAAEGGDRVLLFAGDPVRFPEGQDVAVVLPELQRSFAGRFGVGVLPRAAEDAVARRYGVQRWPSLLFLRDGQYVGTIAGMLDWEVYVDEVARVLALPVSRLPGIGIPLVSAAPADAGCR